MAQSLLAGESVPAFTNVTGSWTPMVELSSQFLAISRTVLDRQIKIIHLAGSTMTANRLAHLVYARLSANPNLKKRLGQIIDTKFNCEECQTAPRPKSGGLDSSLADSLGVSFGTVENDWLDVSSEKLLER
jgi:hypothetical protein